MNISQSTKSHRMADNRKLSRESSNADRSALKQRFRLQTGNLKRQFAIEKTVLIRVSRLSQQFKIAAYPVCKCWWRLAPAANCYWSSQGGASAKVQFTYWCNLLVAGYCIFICRFFFLYYCVLPVFYNMCNEPRQNLGWGCCNVKAV